MLCLNVTSEQMTQKFKKMRSIYTDGFHVFNGNIMVDLLK